MCEMSHGVVPFYEPTSGICIQYEIGTQLVAPPQKDVMKENKRSKPLPTG